MLPCYSMLQCKCWIGTWYAFQCVNSFVELRPRSLNSRKRSDKLLWPWKLQPIKPRQQRRCVGGVVGWSVGLWLSLIFLHNFHVRLVISGRQKMIKAGFLGFTWDRLGFTANSRRKLATCSFHWALSWSLSIFGTYLPLPRLPWHDPPCRMKPVWSQGWAIEMMVVLTGDSDEHEIWMNIRNQTQIHNDSFLFTQIHPH